MEEQIRDYGVARAQDDEEAEAEADDLLDGFVLRNVEIERENDRESESAKRIESEVANRRRFSTDERRGQPALNVGRQLAEKRTSVMLILRDLCWL